MREGRKMNKSFGDQFFEQLNAVKSQTSTESGSSVGYRHIGNSGIAFEAWLRTVCFQKPTPEAYDLAKDAWQAGERWRDEQERL